MTLKLATDLTAPSSISHILNEHPTDRGPYTSNDVVGCWAVCCLCSVLHVGSRFLLPFSFFLDSLVLPPSLPKLIVLGMFPPLGGDYLTAAELTDVRSLIDHPNSLYAVPFLTSPGTIVVHHLESW